MLRNLRMASGVLNSVFDRSAQVTALAGAGVCVLLLAGCVGSAPPATTRLPVEVPARFDAVSLTNAFPETGWLEDFDDPAARALVAEALAHNHDLAAAAARVEMAAAQWRQAGAARWPRLGASAAGSRRSTVSDFGGVTRREETDQFNLGLNLAWEIDLWGKLANRVRAARADYEAETNLWQAARLSLAARTLKAWFSAIELELQTQLARETLEVFENTRQVVEGSYKRGLANRALDVRLARANVEAARATWETRRRQRDAAVRALEVLLGRYPREALALGTNLPSLKREVPPGLPSELLARRPDLRAAERELAAALERAGAARKDLLPTLSLSASGGGASGQLRDLLDSDRLFWNLAANLAQPVFEGGRLRAGVDLAEAATRQALSRYAQTVLNAFREVETALAAETYLRREEEALSRAAEESIGAEQLAWQQYQRGLVDIITVLESQRRAFSARSNLLSVRNARLQNRLDLYLALGGDFTAAAPPTALASRDP